MNDTNPYLDGILYSAKLMYKANDLDALAKLYKDIPHLAENGSVKRKINQMMEDISIANAEKNHP